MPTILSYIPYNIKVLLYTIVLRVTSTLEIRHLSYLRRGISPPPPSPFQISGENIPCRKCTRLSLHTFCQQQEPFHGARKCACPFLHTSGHPHSSINDDSSEFHIRRPHHPLQVFTSGWRSRGVSRVIWSLRSTRSRRPPFTAHIAVNTPEGTAVLQRGRSWPGQFLLEKPPCAGLPWA